MFDECSGCYIVPDYASNLLSPPPRPASRVDRWQLQADRFQQHLVEDGTDIINKLTSIKTQHANKDVRERADQALSAVFHQVGVPPRSKLTALQGLLAASEAHHLIIVCVRP